MIKICNKCLDGPCCLQKNKPVLHGISALPYLKKSKSSVCCVRQSRVPVEAALGQLAGRSFIFLELLLLQQCLKELVVF